MDKKRVWGRVSGCGHVYKSFVKKKKGLHANIYRGKWPYNWKTGVQIVQ